MKKSSFYIKNPCVVNSLEDIDLSEIPSSQRRRLSGVDKVALHLLLKSFEEDIEEIVFSSEFGEFDRLKSIIEQYNEFNEVSPIQFSGSVHNYSAGLFCGIKKLEIPYSSISSEDTSISAGLVQSLISKKKNVLFCYADAFDNAKGLSFVVSKEKGTFKCSLEQKKLKINPNEFEDFSAFLCGKKEDFQSALCEIKRVKE